MDQEVKRNGMSKSKVIDNWAFIKKKLKNNFKNLSDTDLKFIDGREEELYKNIQKRIGISREELIYLFHLYISEKL